MKAKYIFFAALFSMGIFASCTPESIENDNTEQQVDASKIQAPNQG